MQTDRPAASAALGLGWGVVLFGILGHLASMKRKTGSFPRVKENQQVEIYTHSHIVKLAVITKAGIFQEFFSALAVTYWGPRLVQ